MKNLSTCFYCNALIRHHHEKDHFPIPESCAGTITVSTCLSCHDMKDRFALKNWAETWTQKIVDDFPKLSRETRLFLAKAIRLMHESNLDYEGKNGPQILPKTSWKTSKIH